MDHYKLPVQVNHFIITQVLIIALVGIPITFVLTYKNKLYTLFLYCLPVYMLYMGLDYFFIWRKNRENRKGVSCATCLLMFITTPLFFILYFGFYYDTTSLQFVEVANCSVSGMMSSNLEQNENYSILYVDFEYQGMKLLGQACSSNQSRGAITEPLTPSSFYKYGDPMPCNSSKNMTEYRTSYQDIVDAGNEDVTTNSADESNAAGLFSKYQANGNCAFPYTFSRIKIPSWLCIDRNTDIFEELTQPQKCYMNLYQYSQDAFRNGRDREYMRRSLNFPLISFQNPTYYPKADLVCLIMFTYYPFLLSLSFFFKTIAEYLIFFVEAMLSGKMIQEVEKKGDLKNVSV